MYKTYSILLAIISCFCQYPTYAQLPKKAKPKSNEHRLRVFAANHPYIQITGRVDYSNPLIPRFWSPGTYIDVRFTGTTCSFTLNDEVLYGNSHNYLQLVVDDTMSTRVQTTGKINTIVAAKGLKQGVHSLRICKNTESGIGYLELVSISAESLVKPPAKPSRKIEFIGNSITCGMGSDLSVVACDKGQWYDQHNAYYSYGAITARALKASLHLTAVSGIGLIHSCCNMSIQMPQVFDKINLRTDSIPWNFSNYIPDVVTICLGQNDGVQDSTTFCNAYVNFISTIRSHYPAAQVVCLTSPMADARLVKVMKNYLDAIVRYKNNHGDKRVSKFYFSKQFASGCGSHPDLPEHRTIARELTTYLKELTHWD